VELQGVRVLTEVVRPSIRHFAVVCGLALGCSVDALTFDLRQPASSALPRSSMQVTSPRLEVHQDFSQPLNGISANTRDDSLSAMTAGDPAIADKSSAGHDSIPDVQIYDQNAKELKFYSDIVKGNTVAINFIFTTCTTICPQTTAIFRRVQQSLKKSGSNVRLISISVDPETDSPERLSAFAEKFNAEPGWTFVTGDKTNIDSLLESLNGSVGDKTAHSSRIVIINDVAGYRTGISGFSTPTAIVQAITEAAGHK
jgi:cytochrome oxidase Cu insertion factor (SCO1/SenC/PrrC family)